ncbi:collagen alpha-1(I) chain-like [Vidua chalybeata]|uniref:collagen alpha-1(I) chain-like n=1 Tax=Vidua chalybeata TaxID=81927 RepID=UPI0023A7A248|nr:collagen alpha-1(I) chain-like [Vidua chalybeata]
MHEVSGSANASEGHRAPGGAARAAGREPPPLLGQGCPGLPARPGHRPAPARRRLPPQHHPPAALRPGPTAPPATLLATARTGSTGQRARRPVRVSAAREHWPKGQEAHQGCQWPGSSGQRARRPIGGVSGQGALARGPGGLSGCQWPGSTGQRARRPIRGVSGWGALAKGPGGLSGVSVARELWPKGQEAHQGCQWPGSSGQRARRPIRGVSGQGALAKGPGGPSGVSVARELWPKGQEAHRGCQWPGSTGQRARRPIGGVSSQAAPALLPEAPHPAAQASVPSADRAPQPDPEEHPCKELLAKQNPRKSRWQSPLEFNGAVTAVTPSLPTLLHFRAPGLGKWAGNDPARPGETLGLARRDIGACQESEHCLSPNSGTPELPSPGSAVTASPQSTSPLLIAHTQRGCKGPRVGKVPPACPSLVPLSERIWWDTQNFQHVPIC